MAFKFAPSPYTNAPTRWRSRATSSIPVSHSPSVLGNVTIIAATDPSSSAARAARSIAPSAAVGICVTVKPAIAAVAGLVPWALSGTNTRRRLSISPRCSSARRIIKIPASSPWAPAAGARLTCGSPVIAPSARCRSRRIRSVPCAASGSAGCALASPGSDATKSFTLGLYFIEQEPSGYEPVSTPKFRCDSAV